MMATMKRVWYRAKQLAIAPLRTGPREVVWTPDWMGLGNVAYLWLWAHLGQAQGLDRRVLEPAGMVRWLELLPDVRDRLSIPRTSVAFRDRRRSASDHNYGRFGQDFTQAQLATFVDDMLLGSPLLADLPPADPNRLVVNVRRGDYYSVPQHRGQFGFDQVSYVHAAVEGAVAAQGRPSSIHIVSDGLVWCRARLGWLADHTDLLTFAAADDGPVANLREVAGARRLVITNSTFSYWCGYLSNALHRDNHASIWAPRFFDRSAEGRRAWHLDPRWSVVEDIPGGWDS